jgi:hypothetical protein
MALVGAWVTQQSSRDRPLSLRSGSCVAYERIDPGRELIEDAFAAWSHVLQQPSVLLAKLLFNQRMRDTPTPGLAGKADGTER